MEPRAAKAGLFLRYQFGSRARSIPYHGIGLHRAVDILEVLLAQIGELNANLART